MPTTQPAARAAVPYGHAKAPTALSRNLSAMASAPPVDSNTDALWRSLNGQIMNQAVGELNPSQAVCMAGQTLFVDLVNPNANVINANIFNIGNTIPAWGPGYAAYSQLATAYSIFLSNINLGGSTDPNIVGPLNTAAENLNAAQSNFLTVQTNCYNAFVTAQKFNPNLTLPQFIQTSYPTYLQAQAAMVGAQSAYDALATKAYGAGYQVIQADKNKMSPAMGGGGCLDFTTANAFNMPTVSGATAPAGSTPVLPGAAPPPTPPTALPYYVPSFNLAAFTTQYTQWQNNSINKAFNAGGSFTVSSKSQSYDYSSMGWSAQAEFSYSNFFTRVSGQGSASASEVDIDWSDSSNSLQVDFTGLGAFNIGPGQWYDAAAVASYYDKLLPGAPTFFGNGGSMALLPTRIIVGFEPTITLSLSNAAYSSVAKTFQAQASTSVGIGPFSFGASYSNYSDKQSMSYNEASCKITAGPVMSSLPILLGVVCTKLGNQT
ncbi:MAG: hypothetical protein WCK95_17040 [Alphaproteobacteria bacterium]|jgi:hypothetical protein